MPLFSVIVPIYKVEKYLRECVDSILTQSFKDFELILVDDGSPDNCPKICDEYAEQDRRVKVIHKENGGLVSARKAGAKVATGEYIACVDGDDWVKVNYLEKFAEVIKQYHLDIVCCGTIWVYKDKNIEKQICEMDRFLKRDDIVKEIFPKLIENEMGKAFGPSMGDMVIKSQIYKYYQQNVENEINMGEDYACLRPCIYKANTLGLLHECTGYYRQNEESMTKKKVAFGWSFPKLVCKHFENNIPMNEYDFQDQVYRYETHNLFNTCASQFNRKEKYSLIKKDILKHISDPYYQKAINSCKYSKKAYKNRLALFALKHKNIFLMWLYNKLK